MSEKEEQMLLQMEANRLIAELSFHFSQWNTAPAADPREDPGATRREHAARINAISLRLAALRKQGIVPNTPNPNRQSPI